MRLADGDQAILVPPLGPDRCRLRPGAPAWHFRVAATRRAASAVRNLLDAGGRPWGSARPLLALLGSARRRRMAICRWCRWRTQSGTMSATSEILNVQLGADQTVGQATLSGGSALAGSYPITSGTKLSDLLKSARRHATPALCPVRHHRAQRPAYPAADAGGLHAHGGAEWHAEDRGAAERRYRPRAVGERSPAADQHGPALCSAPDGWSRTENSQSVGGAEWNNIANFHHPTTGDQTSTSAQAATAIQKRGIVDQTLTRFSDRQRRDIARTRQSG